MESGYNLLRTENRPPSLQLEAAAGATNVSLDFARFRHRTHRNERKTTTLDGTDNTPGALLSSLGTGTLTAHNPSGLGSSLLLATPSFRSMQVKSTNAPLPKASSTLLFESRSLLPGPSLLSNTPSFLGLKGIGSLPLGEALTASPERLRREPRSSSDSMRSPTTNRNVTVQRLALDLPLSRSSSLSVFLHALEDAAPGWYQSLMDSATPQESDSSSASSIQFPTQTQRSDVGSAIPCHGLPLDMLASLDALEALVTQVQKLPHPRPRPKPSRDIDDEAALFSSRRTRESTARPSKAQLASPPLTPTQDEQGRQPSFPRPASPPRRRRRETTAGTLRGDETPRASSMSSARDVRTSMPPIPTSNGVAVCNIANHPKLTRTLGLSALPPSRLPTPSTPRRRTATATAHPPPPPNPYEPVPPTLNKKASSKSLKAPKTPGALKSIFRGRASAPPVPPLSFAPSDYDEAESPARKPPPLVYRFSEAGPLRREDRRIDGARRHFSTPADADSFLVM